MEPGEEISAGKDSFPRASKGFPSDTAQRGEVENLALFAGGNDSVTSSWIESSIDVGDRRLWTGIDDLTPGCNERCSLGEGSVDAVESLRGECLSTAISDGLLGVADCPSMGCFRLERALISVSISRKDNDIHGSTYVDSNLHSRPNF